MALFTGPTKGLLLVPRLLGNFCEAVLVLRTNGTFEIDFTFADTQQVYQLLMQLRFQNFLSQPNTVRIISLETGLPLASAQYTKGITEPPPAWYLQTIEALNAFQIKLGKLITIPGCELTVDEMNMLEKLRRVFHEGKWEMTLNSFSSPIIPITSENRAELLQQLEPFEGGKAADFPLLLEDFVNLFDIDIPLGRIKPIYVKVKLANEQAVREKLSEQEDGEIQLTFVPSGDKTVVIEYLDRVSGHCCFTEVDWDTQSLLSALSNILSPALDPQMWKWPETLLEWSKVIDEDAR